MLELMEGRVPDDCDTCTKFLKDQKFNMEALQRDIDLATSKIFSIDDGNDEIDEQEVSDDDIGDEGQQKEPKAFLLVAKDPHVTLLQANTHKKRFPVMCNLCKRNCNNKNSIFDLVNPKRGKWYWQHVRAPTHKNRVAEYEFEQSRKAPC